MKKPASVPPRTIDEYIAPFPPEVRERMGVIREIIRKNAPGAEEAIKYQIAAFVLHGNLIFFAGFRNHIGLYPVPRGAEEFQEELAAYAGGKDTAQFPHDRPIPRRLIARIVKYRVRENAERATAKTKKRAKK